MTVGELRRLALLRPFVPFTIYMADGRSVHVAHPDMIRGHEIGRTVVVYDQDKVHTIDLLLVTDVTVDW